MFSWPGLSWGKGQSGNHNKEIFIRKVETQHLLFVQLTALIWFNMRMQKESPCRGESGWKPRASMFERVVFKDRL